VLSGITIDSKFSRRAWTSVFTLFLACVAAATPSMSWATSPVVPIVHPIVFAHHPVGASKPDDITKLGDLIYVTYQNDAGKDGTPVGSFSTIIAYDSTGRSVATYTIPGRCDGLTADPTHNNRILATANEDLNSSLYVIQPGTPQPAHYNYSPDPGQTGSDGKNGGTDAISVTPGGTIYVAHSNPDQKLRAPNNNPAAVYTMKLSGTKAELTPLFGVNDLATVIHGASGAATPLGLTDPDSNRYLPALGGGTLIQSAQADSKLVMATNLQSGRPTLQQLALTNATTPRHGAATPQLDDIAQVTGPGTLYAVDQGASARVYSMDTSAITPGTLFVSQPKPATGDLPNDPGLGIVDPTTGVVTHIASPLTSPKGLLFVPATTKTDAALASDSKTSSSNTSKAGLYGAIALAVLLAFAAAFVIRRRRPVRLRL
jgi:MYXO-CTERM domain-containing protein